MHENAGFLKRFSLAADNLVAQKRFFLSCLAIMAAAGMVMVLLATRWGAALSDDSYYYVKPARDILAGQIPAFSAHYPPLLPLLLTVIGLTGIDPLVGIRLLNAACLGLNIFLAGVLVYRMTGMRAVGLAGAFVFLTSQVMLEIHSWAMSEALFISLCFGTLLAFLIYHHKRQMRWLVVTALLAGCAALSRYAGVSLIAAVGLGLLLLPQSPWKKTIRAALIFGAIAGGLFAVYLLGYSLALHEWSQFGGIRFEILGQPEIREAFYNFLLWLMPGRLARGREILVMASVIGLAGLLIAAYALVKKAAFRENWRAIREQPLFLLLALLVLINLFLLYEAHLSPTYRSPFDTRLLSPNHALLIVLVCAVIGLVWRQNGLVLRLGIVIAFAWIIFLYLPRSVDYIRTMRAHGAGFATPYWAELDAAKFINAHPLDQIVTTAPMGVYFATGKTIRGITPFNPEQLRTFLKQRDGYLVVFESMPLDLYGYPAKEFLTGMVPVGTYSDCVIYQVKP